MRPGSLIKLYNPITFTTTRAMSTKPRRFAALNSSDNPHSAATLKGVVFDVDGTLCLPQNYMFAEMREALGIQKPTDILEHINSLPSSERPAAHQAIKDIEQRAMSSQTPQPGLNELITRLAAHNVRLALCTRNFELPVKHLLEKFVSEEGRRHFSPLITRETEGVKAKPSPEGIWACVNRWDGREGAGEVKCDGVIMVGDSVDDIEAGARAGAATVLLVNDENRHLLEEKNWPKHVDFAIERLDELVDVLEEGFCGRS